MAMTGGRLPGAIGAVMVTGAGGQDGYLLVERLLRSGHEVHAVVRRPDAADELKRVAPGRGHLDIHSLDVLDSHQLTDLVRKITPDEIFNLAGQSSVSASFSDPAATWQTNVAPVMTLLEAVRNYSPGTHLYQASSSEMFGGAPAAEVMHGDAASLVPLSPYAAAKAAAHAACGAYRAAYGIRVTCGIAFNHESCRRSRRFLTRKVVDHVRTLRDHRERIDPRPILKMGNLAIRRDWGYAPDYVEGILLILRQIRVRSMLTGRPEESDTGSSYRDYVLGTGQLHAVWELVDRAFHHGGFELVWDREAPDPTQWRARFADTGATAVVVDSALIRPADPAAIGADPSTTTAQLGWIPKPGLDSFLREMVECREHGSP